MHKETRPLEEQKPLFQTSDSFAGDDLSQAQRNTTLHEHSGLSHTSEDKADEEGHQPLRTTAPRKAHTCFRSSDHSILYRSGFWQPR
jgi:hypothetical protein